MSALVLDTNAWVWWSTRPEKLSRRQRSAIERLRRRGTDALLVSIMLIVATALDHGATLVTSDARIVESGTVEVIG